MIRQLSLFSYQDRLAIATLDRPHYGYCIFQAARLAKLLNYPKIAVIEFGCGGGNGLINAEMHIMEILKIFDIEIELYGFDGGSGLPRPLDYRDMPHYFHAGLYDMDRRALESRLKLAKLVIGDVKDTCATFFEDYHPAPIGCIFHDLDFYSSTTHALRLLNAEAAHLLPRIYMYFDDIAGDDLWLCNEFSGELLAIKEFNKEHASRKITSVRFLSLRYPHLRWFQQIYAFHDFLHPRYNDFVAVQEQEGHKLGIRLDESSWYQRAGSPRD
jgi:hypothetical protein